MTVFDYVYSNHKREKSNLVDFLSKKEKRGYDIRDKTIIFFLILISAFFKSLPAYPAIPIPIDKNPGKINLDRYIDFFVDKNCDLSIESVSSPAYKDIFFTNNKRQHCFRFTRAAIWVRLTTVNGSKTPINWHLELSNPLIDYIEFYVPSNTGYTLLKSGDKYPFNSRSEKFRTFIYAIEGRPGIQTYYLRIKSSSSMFIPLIARTTDNLKEMQFSDLLFSGIYCGLMVAIAFYLLFVFLYVREKSYLYLLFVVLGINFFTISQNGLGFQYIWPNSVLLEEVSVPFFISTSIIFAILFTRSFFNIADRTPLMDLILKCQMYIFMASLIGVFIIPYFYMIQFLALLTVISTVTMFTASLMRMKSGRRETRFYILGSLTLLAGVLGICSILYGMFSDSFILTWLIRIGTALMVLLYSLGVADKINIMHNESKDSLEHLRESAETYRILVENAHDGIVFLLSEKPLYANPSLIRMLGYTAEEFYQKSIMDFLPDISQGDEPVIGRNRHSNGKTDIPSQFSARLKAKDGTIIDVIISSSKISIDGKDGIISIITNISYVKRAEDTIIQQFKKIQTQYASLEALNKELKFTQKELLDLNDRLVKEKERLSATLGSIGDAVITADIDGSVVLINRMAEQLTGYSQETAFGRPICEVLKLKGTRSRSNYLDPVSEIIHKGGLDLTDIPLMMACSDSFERMVEINGSPIRLGGERIIGVVLAIRDITEKHKLEQEILKISKLESLSVLAGGLAHDFNNLLTAIIANLSLAKIQVRDNPECCETISLTENAAQRAAGLTKQLLTFSKGGEPIKTTTSIVDLLKESARFLLTGSNIKSEFYIDEAIHPVDVDLNQMNQVFNNIIINAMQSMTNGGTIKIRVNNVSDVSGLPLAKGNYIRISLEDKGVGIPKRNLKKIFDPYFTTKEFGSGLGLASSYSIIKKHGGYITVESQEGAGSIFHIFLRASDKDVNGNSQPELHIMKREGRILVMDDMEYILDVTRKSLEYFGYKVDCVYDGKEAILRYLHAMESGKPFSAVILDITIPGGMGGVETMQKLKALDPEIRAVVSSGYSNNPVMVNFREYGFQGRIIKPYKLTEMIQVLDEIVNKQISYK